MYRNGIKRLLAVVLSLCGMICLSWLFSHSGRRHQAGLARPGVL